VSQECGIGAKNTEGFKVVARGKIKMEEMRVKEDRFWLRRTRN